MLRGEIAVRTDDDDDGEDDASLPRAFMNYIACGEEA